MKAQDFDTSVRLGTLELTTPLVGAAGTVGSVVEFTDVGVLRSYGALVAKSVSGTPWSGRPAPRLASIGSGMLNGIGIQNPGVDEWLRKVAPILPGLPTPVWGSAVGRTTAEFATVTKKLAGSTVTAVEVNLSCPNLEGRGVIALDAVRSREVIEAASAASTVPIGAKLSPNAADIVEIAEAVAAGGADFLTLTNTVRGASIDVMTRRPVLSGTIGGYSGPPLKPIALAAVLEVSEAMPDVPIVGCGGVRRGEDVIEYLLAGASAVCLGTVHFAEPGGARRILKEAIAVARSIGASGFTELIRGVERW